MDNVRTVLANLPFTIKAYTVCKDDYYTIVLNECLTIQQNLESYEHEIEHIKNGDFEKRNVGLIELFSHHI